MTLCKLGAWVLSVTSLVTILGCNRNQQLKFDDMVASTHCSSLPEYFPRPNSGTGELFYGSDQAEWERNYFQHMKEPPLYSCGSQFDTQPVYRFLWDRSLSRPIAARLVVHPDGGGTLFVRELAHCCMIPPPKCGERAQTWDEWLTLDRQMTIDLSISQTKQVTSQFQTIFNQPFDPNPIGNGPDGSDLIFESRVHGRYRLRDFHNVPPQSAKILGLHLVRDLAGIQLSQGEIY